VQSAWGAFLSPLSLGVQRKRLGRVTDSDQYHLNADSRPKRASATTMGTGLAVEPTETTDLESCPKPAATASKYAAFTHARSQPQTLIPTRELQTHSE
jgi:hypothetical protein